MIKLKSLLKESTDTNRVILRTYLVTFDTSTYTEVIYRGTDKEEAISEYKSFTLTDFDLQRYSFRTDMKLLLEIKDDIYEFIYDDDDFDISEWPIEKLYDDEEIYELIEEGEFVEIDNRLIEPTNKKSDELLHSIQKHYKDKYRNWKYNRIEVINDDGDEVGCIRLRIADHTENIDNFRLRDRCHALISVVIADEDMTYDPLRMGRNENELHLSFTSESTEQEIIDIIEDAIETMKSELLEDYISEGSLQLIDILGGLSELKGHK